MTTRQDRQMDVTAVSAFLAMARKEGLMLNGWRAEEVWQAWARLLELSPAKQAELLCKMLGDEPNA